PLLTSPYARGGMKRVSPIRNKIVLKPSKSLFNISIFCYDSIISAANHSGLVGVFFEYALLAPHGFRCKTQGALRSNAIAPSPKLWNLATKERC
ncbi:MAG: hypothetical protein AAB968_01200, partial [Patescibacteria group bacterium]